MVLMMIPQVLFVPYWQSTYPASVCVNGGGDYKIIFEVTNLWGNAYRTLYSDDCYNSLSKEIFGCPHGGESDGYDFKYR